MTPSESSQTINANGINISYFDSGSSDIPAIFIHGFPFDKSMWTPQLNFLTENTCRVITYDIRGYGKSEKGNAEYSINSFADDLVKFMDALNIKKAIVCGLSMGGYILLRAFSKYADRFHALILADTQCIADSEEGKAKRFSTIKMIEEGGKNQFVEGFIKNIFSENTFKNKQPIVEVITSLVNSTPPEIITATLKALAGREETCSVLSKIKVPVLIICGKEDKPTPAAQSESMHQNIPGSTLHILDDAGHLSNLEQEDKFNNLLNSFVKTIC